MLPDFHSGEIKISKTFRTVLSDRCLSAPSRLSCPVLSVCDIRALWPNGWTDQDETWHSPTQFSTHICCGQMAAWIKMLLGMEVGLSPGDFVLDGDPAFPKFSANVHYSYCYFTAQCTVVIGCSSSSSSFSILCILFCRKKV